mmetsp:Transcript_10443/g.15954  ORF Transcript_10443/g.15954 Transcript_10443/m.15954 type:complete len:291 (+) Transcript_10443:30-902(+)
MAALTRPSEATYVCHEHVKVDTLDHRDHTFCGVMFPIEIKQNLPVETLKIESLAVRGRLGPITVWASGIDPQNEEDNVNEQVQHFGRTWSKIYQHTHFPSTSQYVELKLLPVVLKPGETYMFYIHSSHPSDQAIVYDNARNRSIIYQDDAIRINVGRAHLSTTPFGDTSIWGYPGAWRDYRAFVGQVNYGIIYKLWSPQNHLTFGSDFDQMVVVLLLCQRRHESPMSILPDDCIYYILNMCGYNWSAPCVKGRKILAYRKPFKTDNSKKEKRAITRRAKEKSFLRKIFSR